MEKEWTFDSKVTRDYTRVRQEFTSEFLKSARHQIELRTALDVGCGVGYFSKFLLDMGFQVVAVDGREENAAEGNRRYPEITFLARNVEDPALTEIGSFDFVLCVGLLYHLENPFRAIRNLHSLTQSVLLIESMCLPGTHPRLELLDEDPHENQGLNYVALYPTESCLVKMLYRAGFPFVYRFGRLPSDEQFTDSTLRKRSRTFLAASKLELTGHNLLLADEPARLASDFGPWTTRLASLRTLWGKLLRPRDSINSKLSGTRAVLARLAKQRERRVDTASSDDVRPK